MRSAVLALICGLLAGAGAFAPDKSAQPSSTARKAGANKPDLKAQTAASKKAASKQPASRSRARRQSWRAGQQVPTRERYAEIQQALVQRGYSQSPATGLWGPEWIAALKRFQSDHKLEPNGKLNSLTLIALGLGPNRNSQVAPVTAGVDGQALPPVPQ